jgi:hypothetical protein
MKLRTCSILLKTLKNEDDKINGSYTNGKTRKYMNEILQFR